MISSENSMSQKEISSPAQICADASDLATLLFGSNFSCVLWCAKYCDFNSLSKEFGSSMGFKLPESAHTRTHTHTHAQY